MTQADGVMPHKMGMLKTQNGNESKMKCNKITHNKVDLTQP